MGAATLGERSTSQEIIRGQYPATCWVALSCSARGRGRRERSRNLGPDRGQRGEQVSGVGWNGRDVMIGDRLQTGGPASKINSTDAVEQDNLSVYVISGSILIIVA